MIKANEGQVLFLGTEVDPDDSKAYVLERFESDLLGPAFRLTAYTGADVEIGEEEAIITGKPEMQIGVMRDYARSEEAKTVWQEMQGLWDEAAELEAKGFDVEVETLIRYIE